MNERTSEQTNEQANEQMNERTSEQTNERANEQTNEWANKQTNERTSEQTNERANEQTNKRTSEQANERENERSSERTNERRVNLHFRLMYMNYYNIYLQDQKLENLSNQKWLFCFSITSRYKYFSNSSTLAGFRLLRSCHFFALMVIWTPSVVSPGCTKKSTRTWSERLYVWDTPCCLTGTRCFITLRRQEHRSSGQGWKIFPWSFAVHEQRIYIY